MRRVVRLMTLAQVSTPDSPPTVPCGHIGACTSVAVIVFYGRGSDQSYR